MADGVLDYLVDKESLNKLIQNSPEFNKMLFLSVCRELEVRLKTDKGMKYVPTEKQLMLHKSPCKIRLALGGNRGGKTFWLVMETRWIALDEHPYRETSHMKTIWVAGLDKINMLAGTIIPRFEEAIPERYIERFDKKNFIIYLKNGKKIIFKSCDSGVSKFQSADVDVIAFDEEPPEDIWIECMMRTIDRGGLLYIAETPTNGYSWTYEKLFKKRDGKTIEVIQMSTDENPHIPPEEMERVFAMLSPEEIDMRRHGKYVALGGIRIFPERLTAPLRAKMDRNPPYFKGDIYDGKTILEDAGFFTQYEAPNALDSYYIGADTSEGADDPTGIAVLKRTADKIKLVGIYSRVIEIEFIHRVINDFGRMYPNNLLVVERNSNGSAVLAGIRYTYNGVLYTQEDTSELGDVIGRKLGWRTTRPSKSKMIQDFKELLSHGMFEIYDEELIREMENYAQNNKGEIEASIGHDDRVMAVMLALQGLLSIQSDSFAPITPDRQRNAPGKNSSDRVNWHNL